MRPAALILQSHGLFQKPLDVPYGDDFSERRTQLPQRTDPLGRAAVQAALLYGARARRTRHAGAQCGADLLHAHVDRSDRGARLRRGQGVRASGINDGAAAIVVMSEEKAKELGVTPMATWVAGALGGVEPEIMGVGPVASTRKVLAKTGLSIDDMDLIEANEAFAAQSIAVARDLKFDMSKVNVNGGAIALGHPVGASGCRILVTLLHEMQKRDAKRGLATLCIGGGMGCSTIVER